jgi:hypothetical protein
MHSLHYIAYVIINSVRRISGLAILGAFGGLPRLRHALGPHALSAQVTHFSSQTKLALEPPSNLSFCEKISLGTCCSFLVLRYVALAIEQKERRETSTIIILCMPRLSIMEVEVVKMNILPFPLLPIFSFNELYICKCSAQHFDPLS